MSIDHSDQLHLPDAPNLDLSLEASVTPKFDMCLFRSTLTEKHVEKFSQIYAILLDLHPHVPPAGFTMNQLSNEHIAHSASRAAPIAMSWRHHDSSVADVLPGPSEYDAADFLLWLNSFVFATLVLVRLSPVHYFLPTSRLTTILLTLPLVRRIFPPKTPAMEKAEVACPKVIAARERKKQRAEDLLVVSSGINPADDGRGEGEQHDDQVVQDVAMQEGFARNFGELPFTPVWGLTDSDRMVKFRQCRDMMSNIFTPADLVFFNVGPTFTDYEGRFGGKKALKVKVAAVGRGKIKFWMSCYFSAALWQGEAIRKACHEYFPTLFKTSLSNEYKESVGEVLSLAVGKGFIDGISLGRTKADVDVLLKG
ncbi:hypothetical protein Tco_1556516 [Tanacetum coccineum]